MSASALRKAAQISNAAHKYRDPNGRLVRRAGGAGGLHVKYGHQFRQLPSMSSAHVRRRGVVRLPVPQARQPLPKISEPALNPRVVLASRVARRLNHAELTGPWGRGPARRSP